MLSFLNDDQVEKIRPDRNYYFVRTDGGRFFDTFTNNGFIAIGWNEITLQEITDSDNEWALRNKILKVEGLDPAKKTTQGKVTAIVNKLTNFVNLRKGDVIIIPNEGSQVYAFGIISSGKVVIDTNQTDDCDFFKRKSVDWVAFEKLSDLDATFYKIRISRHTISNIDQYGDYIDNVISKLYKKGDNAHFVLDFKKQGDINVQSLLNLINNIQELLTEINEEFNLGENIDANAIRLRLQSPGQIEFKLPGGEALIILATVISISCGHSEAKTNTSPEVKKILATREDRLLKIRDEMQRLEADKDSINSVAYGHQ